MSSEKEHFCSDREASYEGSGGACSSRVAPFFASLAGEALDFYLPQDLLQALLHHRGGETGVEAVPIGANRQAAHPGPATEDHPNLDDLPPHGKLPREGAARQPRAERRGAPPRPERPKTTLEADGGGLSGGASIAALAGKLQDAVLVGMDLLQEDFRAPGGADAIVQPGHGGRAIFFSHARSSFVVWAATTVAGGVGFFCSCGGEGMADNVTASVRSGVSSRCRHAAAHALALRDVARHQLCSSVPDLLQRFPALDNARAGADDVVSVPVFEEETGRSGHIVGFNRIWCIVITPPRWSRQSRPVCSHVPCRTRSSYCIHSCAVQPPAGGYGGFEIDSDGDDDMPDAGDEDVQQQRLGPDVEEQQQRLRLDDEEQQQEDRVGERTPRQDHGEDRADGRVRPAGRKARKKGQPRLFIDTDRLRRARNMMPCKQETDECALWDKVGRGEVVDGLSLEVFESDCPSCGSAAGELEAAVAADLHTLSGRARVLTRQWVCKGEEGRPCGVTVPFDGAAHGLFAFSGATVYTRTLLDVILFTIISTKSSISAASAVSAFQLHCSGMVFDGDSAQTRQALSLATDEYARTLLVPEGLYKCATCYHCSETPYQAVVADGQTIGIFRDASFPFERDTSNVPTIPISVDNACTVPMAKVRKCIRQRLEASYDVEVGFTKPDQLAMSKFVALGTVAPPLGDHSDASHRAECAVWAASCVFFSFFALSAVPRQERVDRTGSSSDSAPVPASSPMDNPAEELTTASSTTSSSTILDDGSVALTGNGERHTLSGGGEPLGNAPAKPIQAVKQFKYCNVNPASVGRRALLPVVRRERWSILFNFFRTFVAEPVLGVFAGCVVADVSALADALIAGKTQVEWLPLSTCIQSIHVVWPVLDMLADDLDSDPELRRAFGELLMFSLHADLHMEELWRAQMNADSLRYEAQWTNTDAAKFKTWKREQPMPARPQLPTGLRARAESRGRVLNQADEVRSGLVFPSLDQVRTHPRDDAAAAAAQAGREKAKTKRAAKRKRAEMIAAGLGDDDCRHKFLSHAEFTPGVVSYLCMCGVLIGFEVLESAESPAGIVATLAARFPRLPTTVYFDTACQASRNATRRVPWLVRLSKTAWALDRFHAPGHKCSPLFDANNYPARSGLHKTSAAENRHSLNKPLKSHLTYLAQDRFVVQMRMIGAVNNMLIMYRRALGKTDVRHRPLPSFFQERIATRCERVGCLCGRG